LRRHFPGFVDAYNTITALETNYDVFVLPLHERVVNTSNHFFTITIHGAPESAAFHWEKTAVPRSNVIVTFCGNRIPLWTEEHPLYTSINHTTSLHEFTVETNIHEGRRYDETTRRVNNTRAMVDNGNSPFF